MAAAGAWQERRGEALGPAPRAGGAGAPGGPGDWGLGRDPFLDPRGQGALGARAGIAGEGGADARPGQRGLGPGARGPTAAPAPHPAPTRTADPSLPSPAAWAPPVRPASVSLPGRARTPPRRDVTMPGPALHAGRAPAGPRARAPTGGGGRPCSAARPARVRGACAAGPPLRGQVRAWAVSECPRAGAVQTRRSASGNGGGDPVAAPRSARGLGTPLAAPGGCQRERHPTWAPRQRPQLTPGVLPRGHPLAESGRGVGDRLRSSGV